MKHLFFIILAFAILVSCKTSKTTIDTSTKDPYANYSTTPSGLKYIDLQLGSGNYPREGQQVTVNYIGKLEDGTIFENSYTQQKPLTFTLGDEAILKGWNEAILTMKKGGKRIVVIPPELGYGNRKVRNIPANSTLIFEIEVLEIK